MSVIFLNSHRAKSGVLHGHHLPEGYILACKFFDCGIIDRTSTLDQGFNYKVLDPIPNNSGRTSSFANICGEVAADIVARARAEDRPIRVLWSGGIDSTVALIALLRALPEEEHYRIEPLLNMVSVNEYPLFFRRYILHKLPFKHCLPPITNHFGDKELLVTGEHGDQLFGSDKLLPLIKNGLSEEPWEQVLPLHLFEKFGKTKKVDRLIHYLKPQIGAAPQPINTTFELFWWLNYSIKWQQVSLRLPVFSFRTDVKKVFDRTHHFFRDVRFQQWSIANHPDRSCSLLSDYKMVAKEYIHAFTGDDDYLNTKTKEPSLKHVILDRAAQGDDRYRIVMGTDYQPIIETFHKNLKNQRIV